MIRATVSEVGRGRAIERVIGWALIGLVALVAVVVVRDAWRRVGQVVPGFALMANAQVGAGGMSRGGLEPLDVIVAVDGRPVRTAAEVRAEVARHPAGTPITYTLWRGTGSGGERVEATVRSRKVSEARCFWLVIDGILPGLLALGLGAIVFHLRPGTPESRLFLAFCVVTALVNLVYDDMMTTHRFSGLFLAAWPFTPALVLHLAATFPERRRTVDRWPWLVAVPYAVSAALAIWLEMNFMARRAPVGEIIAGYAGLAALALTASLAWTMRASASLLARRRSRVLLWGFGIGYVAPLLGTTVEVVFGITVPHLDSLWRLNFVFPAAVAYAVVRYRLFDLRSAVRVGAIYSAVTGCVALAYAVLLTRVNLSLARLEMAVAPVEASAAVAIAIVLLMNPIYGRVQTLVDRFFFRARYDAQRALESLADTMTTMLELDRLEALVVRTAQEMFHPVDAALLLPAEGARGFRGRSAAGRAVQLPDDGAVARVVRALRTPVTRSRLREDPELADVRDRCLAELATMRTEAVAPVLFRDRVAALLLMGRRRGDADYTDDDLRVLRQLANQSAVALENARAYHALQAALRRVQILESIRANLVKFVPRTVQDLIELAPEAPALAKRDVDVSVLFVDIIGYSRLSERLEAERLNQLVERYFGAFLDEILGQGGDVNETAGDGLMVIFQDEDPRRHAIAAVQAGLGVLRRTAEINGEPECADEPIALHVGVNSGLAAVGATRIEGTAGTRWTYTASGPVTNVAARLAALGEGDAVVLGAATWGRLGSDFAADDLGEQVLRNIDEPVRVFRLRSAIETAPPALAGASGA